MSLSGKLFGFIGEGLLVLDVDLRPGRDAKSWFDEDTIKWITDRFSALI